MEKIEYTTIDFQYVNNNPKDRKTLDCVIRAIASAMEKDYKAVFQDLVDICLLSGYFICEHRCYDKYLRLNGWKKYKMRKGKSTKKYGIYELDLLIKNDYLLNKKIIVVTKDHCTVCDKGVIKDLWDCRTETICEFWAKEEDIAL